MNILLTGGNGFVGSYLCRELCRHGHSIISVDTQRAGCVLPRCDYRMVDILDRDGLTGCMEGTDLVIHLAAKHRFFGISPREFALVNEAGTSNVLHAMDAHRVKKLIFFSTVAVYGDPAGPTDETTDPRPATLYGITKHNAEMHVRQWAEADAEKSAIIIRPTVIFGPHNRGNVYRLIRQIYWRAYLPVGSGDNIKSVAYIENVVDATLFLMRLNARGVHLFNYADTPHMSYKDIVRVLYAGLNRRPPRYHLPTRRILATAGLVDALFKGLGIQFSFKTVIEKMNKTTYHKAEKIRAMGFTPRFTSEEGLKKMAEWYREGKGGSK